MTTWRCYSLLLVLACVSSAGAQEARRPNFVFFLADDLGYTDLGSYGSRFYETPNLDRLAADGVRFTDAYAACQVCSPTRAAIMTGRYPARLGITDYIGAPQPHSVERHWTRHMPMLPAPYIAALPHDQTTLAEALREAGYATFFAGKWHLGGEGSLPEDHGFDINIGGHRYGTPPGGYFSPHNNPKLPDGPEGEHLTDRLAQESVRFLDAVGDRPFFLFLSFYAVHTPLQAKQEYIEKYQAKARELPPSPAAEFIPEGRRMARQVQKHAVYAGMIQSMDEAVGAVLNKLRTLGLEDRTVVIFTSDNGGLSTSEGSPTSNLPLRAGKGWMYEGGIRVPLIVRWPGAADAGGVSATPVLSTDFFPTLLDIAGLPTRPAQHVDGVSLASILRGDPAPAREAIFWHYPHYGNQGGRPSAAVRAGDFKFIEFLDTQEVELYHLGQDVGESRDLSEAMPEKTATMRDRLHAWRREVGAVMPAPNPAVRPPQPRVLLIGDSISMGYTPFVVEMLKGRAEVQRVPGNAGDTWNGLRMIDAWLGRGQWDLIHFNFGLHDMAWRDPDTRAGLQLDGGRLSSTIDEYERNLRAIVARLEGSGARLLFANTTPVPDGASGRRPADAARYNDAARRVMSQRGIPVNDLHDHAMIRITEIQKPADVHFTEEGSKYLAEKVAREILRALPATQR